MSDREDARKNKDSSSFLAGEVPDPLAIQMQALLQEQAEFLQETQKIVASWTKRRQDAMAAHFRSLQAMGNSKDLADLSAAYSEWLTGNMNRIFSDMNDVRQETLRMAAMGQKSMMTFFEASTGAQGASEAKSAPQQENVGKELPKRKAAE
jgi:hypothetical protein